MFGTCVGESENYQRVALPSILRAAAEDDVVLSTSGAVGICAAYNSFIEQALARPDCEGLVLLHDDVEILDPNFRKKALHSVRRPAVGVAGAVGGAKLTGLSWWRARRTAGSVLETRGPVDLGEARDSVDVVDGLLMIVSRAAFSAVTFDEATFPGFHGYDIDYCLAVKDRGLNVETIPLGLFHHTKGGYGNRMEFDAADRALRDKWPERIRPAPRRERLEDLFSAAKELVRPLATEVAGRARRWCSRAEIGQPSEVPRHGGAQVPDPRCPACGAEVEAADPELGQRAIRTCPKCGTGVTWPPPTRSAGGEGIWLDQYGDRRLARRDIWRREARLRLDWTQLYAPEGLLVEVGCGTGEFVRAAQLAGYEAYGVEVSAWAAERARELGTETMTGTFVEWQRSHEGFEADVVVLWHVLEHVHDPLGLVGEIHGSLRDGGRLLLEVPNYGCSEAELLGTEWGEAQLRDHVVHFTPLGIVTLLGRGGFDVEHVLTFTRRLYISEVDWNRKKHAAIATGRPWPSEEFIRVVARRSDNAIPQGSRSPLQRR